MNRRATRRARRAPALGGVLALGLMAAVGGVRAAWTATHDIQLPKETAVLRPSALFGYRIAEEKCGICHSADYINQQPPGLKFAQWTAEMVKMQHAYGAPLDEEEIKSLAIYLTSVYGDAATVPPASP